MDRRTLLVVGCVGLLAAPLAAEAQQAGRVPRIGVLVAGSPSSTSTRTDAFRQGLRDLGYVEGQNNMKTAKALGLTIPPSVLARADAVINQ